MYRECVCVCVYIYTYVNKNAYFYICIRLFAYSCTCLLKNAVNYSLICLHMKHTVYVKVEHDFSSTGEKLLHEGGPHWCAVHFQLRLEQDDLSERLPAPEPT